MRNRPLLVAAGGSGAICLGLTTIIRPSFPGAGGYFDSYPAFTFALLAVILISIVLRRGNRDSRLIVVQLSENEDALWRAGMFISVLTTIAMPAQILAPVYWTYGTAHGAFILTMICMFIGVFLMAFPLIKYALEQWERDHPDGGRFPGT